ncbi:MAG: Pvc16 family protein [Kovacikia sp.]
MLQDLDKTVEELLRRQLPPEVVRQVSFSFGTPDKESIKTTPAINLFLYDLRENLELRSNVEVLQPQSNGTALKNRPSARVDCSYSGSQLYEVHLQWLRTSFRKDYEVLDVYHGGAIRCI